MALSGDVLKLSLESHGQTSIVSNDDGFSFDSLLQVMLITNTPVVVAVSYIFILTFLLLKGKLSKKSIRDRLVAHINTESCGVEGSLLRHGHTARDSSSQQQLFSEIGTSTDISAQIVEPA